MSTLQQQARALGDPTRHEIFRYLVDAEEPVAVAELTERLSINHNAVRQHLAKLIEAELVLESLAPSSGRGRPKHLFEANPAADARWGATGPYERLSVLLTEVLRTGEQPVEVGRRAGRRLRVAATSADPVERLRAEIARQGFEPSVRRSGQAVTYTLASCPFVSAVLADPTVVCQLHLGLARGVADQVDGLDVEELVARDPRTARCRLICRSGGE